MALSRSSVTKGHRMSSVLVSAIFVVSFALLFAQGAMAAQKRALVDPPAAPPLPIAPYSTHPPTDRPYHVCPPSNSQRVGCDAIAVPRGALKTVVPAPEGGGVNGGLSPNDIADAYRFDRENGAGQTIAIVDAYDDPKAEADLAVYREKYGLPPCTTENGCFRKVNQRGEEKNYPAGEPGWAAEISLDLDMASAVCPKCKLLLVEADDPYFVNMTAAVEKAAKLGPTSISLSWGAREYAGSPEENKYYNYPGIPVTASTGDSGYEVEFPAASPYVIAVGGTSLRVDNIGSRGWSEEVWSGAGSGCSKFQSKPSWQKDTGCAGRAVADVSAVADPATGVSVYDSYELSGWRIFGGTSAAAPIIAGIEALSSSTFRTGRAESFYTNANTLHDIAQGSNGTCTPPATAEYLCTGEFGYDGPTGNGTPGLILDGRSIVTSRVGGVGAYEAELQGSIDPQGSSATYYFEYGQTLSMGNTVPVIPISTGSGTSPAVVKNIVFGLEPETTYYYRLVAFNEKGGLGGEFHKFTTIGPKWAAQPTYQSSIGSEGTLDGQFRFTGGVAIDPRNGKLWVTDSENSRIQEFAENGTFLRKAGSPGSGDGQFSPVVRGIDVDSAGNVWVADTWNNRIQKFNENGSFLIKFGTEGTEGGQLLEPWDVAVDASGNVWVADTQNNRIQEFSGTGTLIRGFAAGFRPRGVAVDADGNVWSVTRGGTLEKHDAVGNLLLKKSIPGQKPGQLFEPGGLDIDQNGNVYVSNFNHGLASFSRIEVFGPKGMYERSFSSEPVEGAAAEFEYPTDVVLDPRGNIWIADSGFSQLDKWKVPSKWPPTYQSAFGSLGTGNGQFKEPAGVGVNPVNGFLAVADYQNDRVQMFTGAGEFIRAFGSAGTGTGKFENPLGVSFDSKGNVWVADSSNNRVQEFSEKGEFIRAFGSFGTATGQFNFPAAVAPDAAGNVWVADALNKRVQLFTEAGAFVRSFSTSGGTFDVDVDAKGNVWTTSESGGVEVHSETGTLIRKFGATGSGPGQLWHPRGLDVDAEGNVWVADNFNDRVQVFSERGEYLAGFGSTGTGKEQFSYPLGIAVDPRGFAWIGDQGNNRIDKWRLG
jgi:DNA-binding beta-propeller fold protein YncE